MNLEGARQEARALLMREALVRPAFSYGLAPDGTMAAGACTIGPALERRVGELFSAGRRLLALELDALGNERLFCLARRALGAIERDARRRGQQRGDERYPGDDGMTREEQSSVLEFARAASIGVTLSAGGMLLPVKSMSFVVPLGAGLTKAAGGLCRRCAARERCAASRR